MYINLVHICQYIPSLPYYSLITRLTLAARCPYGFAMKTDLIPSLISSLSAIFADAPNRDGNFDSSAGTFRKHSERLADTAKLAATGGSAPNKLTVEMINDAARQVSAALYRLSELSASFIDRSRVKGYRWVAQWLFTRVIMSSNPSHAERLL